MVVDHVRQFSNLLDSNLKMCQQLNHGLQGNKGSKDLCKIFRCVSKENEINLQCSDWEVQIHKSCLWYLISNFFQNMMKFECLYKTHWYLT